VYVPAGPGLGVACVPARSCLLPHVGCCTLQSVFLDFLAGVVGHTSSLSGVPLREDPVIAGWQLAEAPAHPGHPSSEELLVSGKQRAALFRHCKPGNGIYSGNTAADLAQR
jgi:hypothetical protein